MDLKVNFSLPVTAVAVDKFGNPTGAFDVVPNWSLSEPSKGALVVAQDGLSAVLVPSGPLGAEQVRVDAVAAGLAISGVLDLSLVAGDAVSVSLQAGTPVLSQ